MITESTACLCLEILVRTLNRINKRGLKTVFDHLKLRTAIKRCGIPLKNLKQFSKVRWSSSLALLVLTVHRNTIGVDDMTMCLSD